MRNPRSVLGVALWVFVSACSSGGEGDGASPVKSAAPSTIPGGGGGTAPGAGGTEGTDDPVTSGNPGGGSDPGGGDPDAGGNPDSGGTSDGGNPDSGGTSDGGNPDSGGTPDGGKLDAGGIPDAGKPDAGGTPDAGKPDAGTGSDGGGPTSGPPTLGAHVLLTQDQNLGTNPAVAAAITTQATGSTLLAISMGWISNFAVPTDTFGNTWTSLGGMHGYAGTDFYTAVWSAASAHGGAGHKLSAGKAGDPTGEISLALVEIKNGGKIKGVAYAYPSMDQPNTAGSVTTDGPATLIAIWSGDSWALQHTATPNNGFVTFDSYLNLGATSGVQIALASKQVSAAGTYSMTWIETPLQGAACYLIAVETGP